LKTCFFCGSATAADRTSAAMMAAVAKIYDSAFMLSSEGGWRFIAAR
jgi:hypothetical protein